MIAAWRLKLDGILDVFNVRSVTSGWPLLTPHFQTDLATDPHVTVSDNHDTTNSITIAPNALHDVSKTNAIISEVRNDVTNACTIVSNVHRNTLRVCEDTDGRNQAVRITLALPVTEWPLTAAQTHARSAISTTTKSST